MITDKERERLMENGDPLRAAVRQYLLTDRLLGLKSVPIPSRVHSPPVSLIHSPQAQEPVPPRPRQATSPDFGDKTRRLRTLDEQFVRPCRKCELCNSRTQTVFGQGNPDARLVFVGEAPGFEEDKQGSAFVGRAGQLLTKMIIAMGLSRDDVFICNVLKCRPPGNRDPMADEILACSPYLLEQLQVIEPEVLIALGAPAAKTLLNTAQSIGKLRGSFHDFFLSGVTGHGPSIPLMPTYHPAYLLRNPADKGKTWEDLQLVMDILGLQGARKR
jgi:DNA polymerase